jgi:dsRNA-specific ribonuclease
MPGNIIPWPISLSEKNQLQEFCQKRYWNLPHYISVRTGGPDHVSTFSATVTVHFPNGKTLSRSGTGLTIKHAEFYAAAEAVRRLRALVEERGEGYFVS